MERTIKQELRLYKPAIALERIFPRSIRRYVKGFLYVSTSTLFAILIFYVFTESYIAKTFTTVSLFNAASIYFGWFLISFSLLLLISFVSFFYNARFYRGIETIVHGGRDESKYLMSYEASDILLHSKKYDDVVIGFLNSKYGREIILRSGIVRQDIIDLLKERIEKEEFVSIETLSLNENELLTIDTIAHHVFKYDDKFKKFLFDHGVTEEVYNGSVDWVMQTYHHSKHDTRWWSKENLGRVSTIGSEWSYGGAYLLERFARNVRTGAVFSVLSGNIAYANEKIDQIESVLARAKEANVLLVGERGVGKMDVIIQLAQKIRNGKAVSSIVHKRLVVFDAEGFAAAHNSKSDFEPAIVKLFSQAVGAGNIIMVIENLPGFLASAESLGSDVGALIDMYLTSPELQVIAMSDPVRFHNEIETKPQIMQRFERVQIESPDLASTERVLESIALNYENKYGILFTYLSISEIAESADRFITDGVMPDKAVELLTEIAPHAKQKKIDIITSDFVYEYVGDKTGIKAGPVKEEERESLMNLEKELHKRVIGQDNAINAISSVMRRSRAGIQNEHRPLGSFLFLGSTGVGKTETAKALAAVFFGDERRMSRIDMSEFSGDDALERLIGGDKKSGILSNLLKEKPYGVLLLDEFEKATDEVHNLFLQVLDEGFFSDNHGARISARNSIIIATSNAGSSLIWDIVKQRKNPAQEQDKIIEYIIHEGVYRPELINRFDGTIIFEPLNLDEQEQIALLLLSSLKKRMQKKGYELVIDKVLISMLVKEGYSPEFGARPMRRVMQDVIEDKIAKKIIGGKLKKGEKIWFYAEDFE